MVRMAGFTTYMRSPVDSANGHAVLTDKRLVFGTGKLLKETAAGESANFAKLLAAGDVTLDIPLTAIKAVTSGKQGVSTLLVIETHRGEAYKFAFMKKAVHTEWETAVKKALTTIGG